ncbi:prenyltransferase [Galenea microaerophila]
MVIDTQKKRKNLKHYRLLGWMIIGTMRPFFLVLTLAVVHLGIALAVYEGASFSYRLYFLTLMAALSAHASVNMLNEYEDYLSGLDNLTQRTPFSGGSGRLQAYPDLAKQAAYWVRHIAYGLLGISITIGIYFVFLRGWQLLPLGVVGVILIVAYTRKITRQPWLCLVAPGIAFGPIMVMGSYFVFAGHYSWSSFAVSLIPFFLVNNLLLLNQIPDEEADRKVGRYNLIMLLGRARSLSIFQFFLLGSYLLLLLLVAIQWLPTWALLGLLTLVLAVPLFFKIHHAHQDIEQLLPLLAWNVIINIVTPLLIALGLYLHGHS